jgi:hypothetical protein
LSIEAISAAATIALATSIAYLLIAKSWSALNRLVGEYSRFDDSIMQEAAQRFRDEFNQLSASQSIYFGGVLVFGMLFAAAYVLEAQKLFAGYPDWQLKLHIGFLGFAAIFATYKIIRTIVSRHKIRLLRDASLAIGHQLQQLSSGSTHVFHDIQTSAGIIDHVVISRHGVYAVNVIAMRASKGTIVQAIDNQLAFSDREDRVAIVPQLAKNSRLAKHFTRLIGQQVRVRSVIAVPGLETTEQRDEQHLVVNERNVSMLLGWRDKVDYLMDDDIDVLKQDLRSRCRRRVSDKLNRSV